MAGKLLVRSDTVPFFPFEQAQASLSGSVAVTPHDAPVPFDRAIVFEARFQTEGIQPSFDLRLNVQKAATDSGLSERELSLAIFVRNPGPKRHLILAQWPLKDAPQNWSSDSAIRISPGAELGALIFLNRARPAELHKAYRYGSIIEAASIRVISEQPKVTFPVMAVPPEQFVKHNLPGDALHAVRFKEGSVDRPVADVIEVWVNTKYLEQITAALSRPDGRAVSAALAASIYASIARGTLSVAKLPPKESEGLLEKIRTKIKGAYQVEDTELLLLAKDPQNPFIEAVSQLLVSLHKNI